MINRNGNLGDRFKNEPLLYNGKVRGIIGGSSFKTESKYSIISFDNGDEGFINHQSNERLMVEGGFNSLIDGEMEIMDKVKLAKSILISIKKENNGIE